MDVEPFQQTIKLSSMDAECACGLGFIPVMLPEYPQDVRTFKILKPDRSLLSRGLPGDG